MTTILRRTALLGLVILLAACAAPTPRVAPPPGALAAGQTITLVRTAEVKQYTIFAPHAGMAFGAIGGLIAGAHMENRAKDVRQLMLGQKLLAHDVLTEAVARELEQAGFRVNIINGPWIETNGQMTLNIDKIDASHERILLIAPAMIGFWAEGMSGNYQPLARVRATMAGQDRKKLLYDAHHVSGFKPQGQGWIYVPPAGPGFASFEALTSNPAATAASLRQGLELVARSVVQDMLGTPTRSAAAPRAATPAAAPAAAPASRAALPVPAQVAALSGQWSGFYGCGTYVGRGRVESPAAWTAPVTMTVDGTHATMSRGSANYSETLTGEIGADLSLQLQGKGAMTRTPDQPWTTRFSGKFSGSPSRFDGTGTLATASGEVSRHCTVDLVKR